MGESKIHRNPTLPFEELGQMLTAKQAIGSLQTSLRARQISKDLGSIKNVIALYIAGSSDDRHGLHVSGCFMLKWK